MRGGFPLSFFLYAACRLWYDMTITVEKNPWDSF